MPDDVHPPAGSPRDEQPANGSLHQIPPFARRLPDDDNHAPIDLVAVQADDALVNALGARPAVTSAGGSADQLSRAAADGPAGDGEASSLGTGDLGGRDTDDRLVAMLAAWRTEIDAEPIPELVDLDAAVAAVNAGIAEQAAASRRRRAGRLRQLAPLVAAAAIIVATVAGVGLGSHNAMPGDTLWAIQKVVDPERAESVEAKVQVESRLETVRAALKQGDTATAAKELEAIRTEIPAVRGQEGQPQLVQEQAFLAAKLADTPPGQPADLSTPPKSNPAALPTGTPGVPPPPPAGSPAAVEPSPSPSASEPKPTEPDVRKSVPDRASAALAPPPVRTEPVAPAPGRPAPDVTSAPEASQPEPKPEPSSPKDSEGKPDPTVDPAPVVAPPASDTDTGTSSVGANTGGGTVGGGSSDTTAAGAAGANVDTTATDPTS